MRCDIKITMGYHNGHDADLVDKIHLIANNEARKPMFYSILTFLAKQYADEVFPLIDRDELMQPWFVPSAEDINMMLVMNYSYEILSYVLDDKDLETIISFCRINEFLPNDYPHFHGLEELEEYFSQKLH